MPLSWNEIKIRAVEFSKEWENTSNEKANAQTFLDHFFDVFGITRRKVATFEHKIKLLNEHDGYIDLLWKGTILVEMKSLGKDLDRAYKQARDYINGLPQHEIPRYILVSDFAKMRVYDVEEETVNEFEMSDFVNNVHLFSEVAGYKKIDSTVENPVDIEATENMALIHDYLKEAGYTGHQLEVFLVRLVFCLFADDTTLFNHNIFERFLINNTNEDGSGLGSRLIELFNVLNTPKEKRMKNIEECLSEFPYVDGDLYSEYLSIPSFNSKMRDFLLICCQLDWSLVSPAIFGSMFQNIINPDFRRLLGAHFTSERNILRLIKPLFLDELWVKFNAIKGSKAKLEAFHDDIARLRFLDPACGCGNFLVVTYREMRKLELEILKTLHKGETLVLNVKDMLKLDVDSYFGIEIEEFPAKVAELALWLTDHQMNILAHKALEQYFVGCPFEKKANIYNENAMRIDWESLSDRPFDYILGNPPFVGKQNERQQDDQKLAFNNEKGTKELDYVTCWYIKAAEYMYEHRSTKTAFVSTNSIAQGQQVGTLWGILLNRFGMKINFAHRTFKWSNEAKNNAAVYVVIIGFSKFDEPMKQLFEYEDIKGEPQQRWVKNISPYLVEGSDLVIPSRDKPISPVPEMLYGNKPADGGFLFMSDQEYEEYILKEPQGGKYIKPLVSAREFIHNEKRWCFWLVDADFSEIKKCPLLSKRIESVREFRLKSKKASTVALALKPAFFTEIRQPQNDYLLIPRVSSELRRYVPMAFFTPEIIVSDTCISLPNATIFHFGLITSHIHMTWMGHVCGRLKSDFRYSIDVVYNNFPWPENPTEKQIKAVEAAAQKVLDVRANFPDSSLADLYDHVLMQPELVDAHRELDKAVDKCYRSQPFKSETERMEFLFSLYEKITAPLALAIAEKPKKATRKRKPPEV